MASQIECRIECKAKQRLLENFLLCNGHWPNEIPPGMGYFIDWSKTTTIMQFIEYMYCTIQYSLQLSIHSFA